MQYSIFATPAEQDQAERLEYRSTPRAAVAALVRDPELGALLRSLAPGHWLDPCAGAAELPAHLAAEGIEPAEWSLVELRADARPHLVRWCSRYGMARAGYRIADYLAQATPVDADVAVLNPPWFERLADGRHACLAFVEQCWLRAPGAHVFAHGPLRWLDEARASWWREHAPTNIYPLDRRLAYGDGLSGASQGRMYPGAVAWYHWAPGDTARSSGVFRVLAVPDVTPVP